jgi:benzoylformate decarboxylase
MRRPALDLPGLDIVGTAKAFGCISVAANTADEIKKIFAEALDTEGSL